MSEIPDEEIDRVAGDPAVGEHSHDGVTAVDTTLLEHLRSVHGLDAKPTLSPATQEGLHDRLHDTTKAADE